jgi:formylglycine-generating enzyme required for sulfatase activity
MNSDKSLPSDEKPSVPVSEESADQTIPLEQQATPDTFSGIVLSPPARSTPAEAVTVPEVRQYGEPIDSFALPGYEILGEVGHGGMGVVYKALQLSLDRVVALKCLPPSLRTDPDRLRQFRIEARAAAQLTKHGVLPVYDVIQTTGTPVLVMPYIAGSDLAHIITDRIEAPALPESEGGIGGWASLSEEKYQEQVLRLMDRIIEALVHLHRADVLHRDIKPSNILVDEQGDGWLADFGLAQLGMQSVPGLVTQSVGTPGYMSPEQWDGVADLDGRADVFSLAVTIYQALALERPYGRNRLKITTPLPVSLNQVNPHVPDEISSVIMQALHPDRAQRFTGVEFRDAWNRARRSTGAVRQPPPPRRLAAAVGVLLAVAFLGLIAATSGFGKKEAVMEKPAVATSRVLVTTEPAGARVVFVPLHPETGVPDPAHAVRSLPGQTTPLTLDLPAGQYFVEAETQDHRFHQVYREIPKLGEQLSDLLFAHRKALRQEDGTIEIATIKIPKMTVTARMARHEGARPFHMGDKNNPQATPQMKDVYPFWLDVREVTEAEYRLALDILPMHLRPPRGDNYPVAMVTYDEAMHCAEKMGKRLPTEEEYEWAATVGGTQNFPWGDDVKKIKAWPFDTAGEPKYDRTPNEPAVEGLYSNVAEWTTSWLLPPPGPYYSYRPADYMEYRIVRGGPYSVALGKPLEKQYLKGPRDRYAEARNKALPGLGFRCARSVRPLYLKP